MPVIERAITATRFHLRKRQRREVIRRRRHSYIEIIMNDDLARELPKTERDWRKFLAFFEEGFEKCKEETGDAAQKFEKAKERERAHESRFVRAQHLYQQWKGD